MDFRILGPVEARENGRPVPLGGPKQRALLAVLLLNAGRVVSRDRLIDELWGGSPPATAATALHGHVSALRKALGVDAILTRNPGYLLELGTAELDLARFEDLRADARERLEKGDPRGAAARLRTALDLWRGEALADIRFEPGIEAEAARLDELHLAVLEDRIDADLAGGDHDAGLAGEIERLLAAHPLRERLWGQLMLALYRSGRQADALAAYRRARKVLISELGIEPSDDLRELEARILAQDPALGARPRPRRPPRRRHALPLALAGLLAAGLLVVLLATGGDDEGPPVPPNALAIVDPRTNEVTGSIGLDSRPGPVAAGAGAVWVLNLDSTTVSRIDPRSKRLLRTAGIGGSPGNLAASRGEVWIADGCHLGGSTAELDHIFTSRDGGTVLDSDVVSLEGALAMGEPQLTPLTPPQCGLAAGGQSAWVATNLPPGIVRIDFNRTSGESRIVTASPLPRAPTAIAAGAGSVWAADNASGIVRRIDPASGRVVRSIRVGNEPVAIAASAAAVWVVNRQDGSVSRIDPRTSSVTKAVSVGELPAAVATGAGSVWVANGGDRSLSRIDPRTNRVVETVALGRRPEGVTVAAGSVWVTVRR